MPHSIVAHALILMFMDYKDKNVNSPFILRIKNNPLIVEVFYS